MRNLILGWEWWEGGREEGKREKGGKEERREAGGRRRTGEG
jgi:hypothetical protein